MEDTSKKDHHGHDTHAIPPQAICNLYKKYQKMDDASVASDPEIVDFKRGLTEKQKQMIRVVDRVPKELIRETQREFVGDVTGEDEVEDCLVYELLDFPGLKIYSSLLPPKSQVKFLSSVLHRDLANPLHKTNLHQDYRIPYPSPPPDNSPSFFTVPNSTSAQIYTPLNPHSGHKPLNTAQFLSKKLRWLTLGTQYDWMTRAYPVESASPFPEDIRGLVKGLFKSAFEPESGVCLLYSTKDYMPVHRDVSENCEKGLASFSLGCDGLFIVSRYKDEEGERGKEVKEEDKEMEMCVLRVGSGDCVWMGGETRWCWHAMPKVIGGSCPSWLAEWPVVERGGGEEKWTRKEERELEKWRGFMRRKRLNVSCRQVWG